MKCEKCNSEFSLWRLAWKKGCCPSCGEKIPVSEYCHGVPDRGWWRLFRGAPLGLKLAAISLVLLVGSVLFKAPLAVSELLKEGGRGWAVQAIAADILLVVILFRMMGAALRGRIPCVCIAILAVIGCVVVESLVGGLVLVVALLVFTLSFLTPAARRWGGKCREADLAYWVAARSGAFPFRRMVAKCILKKMVVGAILLVCLGSFAYTPESIGLMCDWLKDRYVELMSGGCR